MTTQKQQTDRLEDIAQAMETNNWTEQLKNQTASVKKNSKQQDWYDQIKTGLDEAFNEPSSNQVLSSENQEKLRENGIDPSEIESQLQQTNLKEYQPVIIILKQESEQSKQSGLSFVAEQLEKNVKNLSENVKQKLQNFKSSWNKTTEKLSQIYQSNRTQVSTTVQQNFQSVRDSLVSEGNRTSSNLKALGEKLAKFPVRIAELTQRKLNDLKNFIGSQLQDRKNRLLDMQSLLVQSVANRLVDNPFVGKTTSNNARYFENNSYQIVRSQDNTLSINSFADGRGEIYRQTPQQGVLINHLSAKDLKYFEQTASVLDKGGHYQTTEKQSATKIEMER